MSSTKIVKVDPLNPNQDHLKEAANILARGGLVIMPTETVYGIGANMADTNALERLYAIKKRPKDKPFSLHIDTKEKIEDFAQDIPTSAYKLMDKFWPGPLTLILKAKDKGTIGTSTSLECHGVLQQAQDASKDAKAGRSKRSRTIGIRLPDDDIALSIISLSKVNVVCPSANISGKPAPTNFQEAIKDLNGLVDFALDAGSTRLGIESSIVDLSVEPLRILREGAIKKEDIEAVAKKKVILFICTGNSCRSIMAKALLEKNLKERGRQDIEILSAGIMMLEGLGATEEVKELLIREGIDMSGHRSQKVNKEMIKKADIILVMERMHEQRVLELVPEAKNKLFLLKEFAKISDNNLDIADPIGKPYAFYSQIFSIIKEAVERISDII